MEKALIYRVRPENPEAHLFAVTLEIPEPPAGELKVSMPAWIPGSYMIRDFARNIVSTSAEDGAGPIALRKVDKQTWRLRSAGRPISLRYLVYAWELSVRTAHLDRTHAYFNGPCLFLRVAGLDRVPCQVELMPPAGDTYLEWRVATSLPRLDAELWGFGTYRADDYRDLIDHPVEMGIFTLVEFEVGGVPHRMAITGRHRTDTERVANDLARICKTHAALFGELPLNRYLFMTTIVEDGYGGLEHRFSSSLICSRDQLPSPRPGSESEPPTSPYRRFLGLCSHEYFHLWNVKRIRPEALTDPNLEREVHTRLLWAFEGITSYYDDLALVRSGCIDARGYLEVLAQIVTAVVRNPGRHRQTVAESSFDAWTKFYKQDENGPNAVVSYYTKGALVALALDLTIRSETDNARSLDDLMRALWQRYGKSGIGVPERGIEALAEEVTGIELSDFFAQALDSTRDLNLGGLLRTMGIELRMRPARGTKDSGGVCDQFETAPPRQDLGIRLRPNAPEPVLGVVLAGGPAETAGLAAGDTLVAIDGIRIQQENLDALLAPVPPGQAVEIHAFRRDELLRFQVLPRPAPADTCQLRILTDDPQQTARRRQWLQSPA